MGLHKNVEKSSLCGFEQARFCSLQCSPERSPLLGRAVSSIMHAGAYPSLSAVNLYELHFA